MRNSERIKLQTIENRPEIKPVPVQHDKDISMPMNMLKKISDRKAQLITALAATELILLILSIPFYKINGDEAWCAEQAYFMSKKGYSTSNLFTGFDLQNVRIVVQHKLFIYLGAALFRLFHFGLFVFRLIPICSFALLLFFSSSTRKHFFRIPAGCNLF